MIKTLYTLSQVIRHNLHPFGTYNSLEAAKKDAAKMRETWVITEERVVARSMPKEEEDKTA